MSPRSPLHAPPPRLLVRSCIRVPERCVCTCFEADPCRDGRERDDLVIRCRCEPAGHISGRRTKSHRASSNPASEWTSGGALLLWLPLPLDSRPPLLGRACRIRRTSLARLDELPRTSWCPLVQRSTIRRSGPWTARRSSRSARTAARVTCARGRALLLRMQRR
jgi:hypothetical protein